MNGFSHGRADFSVYARAAAYQAYTGHAWGGSPSQYGEPTLPAAFKRVAAAAKDAAVADAYVTLLLQSSAPFSVVKAAYRRLAARRHPDVGGDVLAMTRLNLAYDTLRSHLGT